MTVEYGFDYVREVALSEAARRGAEATARYLSQERSYQDLPDGELDSAWVTAMHTWASAPSEQPTALYGLESDLVLRGRVPPHALARDDIGQLGACAMARIARMPAEERQTAGRRIVDRHLDEWARHD